MRVRLDASVQFNETIPASWAYAPKTPSSTRFVPMRLSTFALALGLAVAGAGPSLAAAQAAPASGAIITLTDALALARRNNPALQNATNARRTAAAAVRSANGAFIPSVNSSVGGGYREGRQTFFQGQGFGSTNDQLSTDASVNASLQLSLATLNDRRAAQANQQTGLQAGLANQDALLRAALANQQAGMQAQQFNITNLQGIQQANQAANLQAALANQQAGQRGFEFGATQNLQTQLANRDFAAQQAQQRFANLGAVLGAEQTMLGADRAYAGTMAGALAGITPAAISQAGIGQNAAAIPLGFTGYEAGVGLGSNVGPRMFNPDVGVNLALANQANQAGYGAAVAGGAATAAGARAGATANVAGSFAQTLPYLLGNMNFGGSTASAGVPASLSRTGTPYQAPGSGFSYGRPGG